MLAPSDHDPFLWLEDISSEEAESWVRCRNERTLQHLTGTPHFDALQRRLLTLLSLDAELQLPTGAAPSGVESGFVFNLLQNAEFRRGVWRCTTKSEYDSLAPNWRVLLDLDALACAESRDWTWRSAFLCGLGSSRCLVALSDGGADAVELREFDLETGSFVRGGFHSPLAKQNVAWLDQDNLLISAALGEGTVTDSGYARQVRLWGRGSSLDDAPIVLSISPSELGIGPRPFACQTSRRVVIDQRLTFWTGRIHHVLAGARLSRSPLPDDAELQIVTSSAAFALTRSALAIEGKEVPAGSVIAYHIQPDGTPSAYLEHVYSASSEEAIQGVTAAGDAIYIVLLRNVEAQLKHAWRDVTGWRTAPVSAPDKSTILPLAGDPTTKTLYVKVSSFLAPDQIRIVDGTTTTQLNQLPPRFNGHDFEVQQFFANSSDADIPYFIVRKRLARCLGPTLVWLYGGFRASITPTYPPPYMQVWLEQGGSLVFANLRGGGEFGPAWHDAARGRSKQHTVDDLHAVASDLRIRRTATHVGIHGRSNGGLIVGAAFTQRPELYDAVLMGVPLADMRRFHLLLAGASWIAEYGNPEDPEDWNAIRRYSPYQAVRRDNKYPPTFIYTSTRDDRVHPGHARKMAARLDDLGHQVSFYETSEGGHSASANASDNALLGAMQLAFLRDAFKLNWMELRP